MSLLDKVRRFGRAFLSDDRPANVPAPKMRFAKSLREQVWEAPAYFNRATRRAAGLVSRYWRWDHKALGYVPQAPRYIRRHYKADVTDDGPDGLPVTTYGAFTHPKTRRQRRHRARILAIARRNGL